MMSDTYWTIGLKGVSGADREELLLEVIAEQSAGIRSLEKEIRGQRESNRELRVELRRVFAVRRIGGVATFGSSPGGAVSGG